MAHRLLLSCLPVTSCPCYLILMSPDLITVPIGKSWQYSPEHFSRVFGLLASLLSTSLCRLNVSWDRQDAYLATPLSPVPKCTELPIFLRYAAFFKITKWYSILDPKYSYSLHRSTINPQTELDVFVIESLWSFPLLYTSFFCIFPGTGE